MENNALITLIGKQLIDGEEDSYELTTVGKYTKQNGKYLASYEGSELTGHENTTTTLKIKDDFVSMVRFGKNSPVSQMVFQERKQYTGIYNTPYGNMTVDVYTKAMSVDINDDGGEINLDYLVQLNDCAPVRNNLTVKIRKVEE